MLPHQLLSNAALELAELEQQIQINDNVLEKLQCEVSLNAAKAEGSERSFRAHRLLLQEEVVTVTRQIEAQKREFEGSVYGPHCLHFSTANATAPTITSSASSSSSIVKNHRGTAFVPRASFDALMVEKTAKEKALAMAENDLRALASVYIDGLKEKASSAPMPANTCTDSSQQQNDDDGGGGRSDHHINSAAYGDAASASELQEALSLYIASFLMLNASANK